MEKGKTRICPNCGQSYTDYPALSRKDNKTEICNRCGMEEALGEMLEHMTTYHKCIFEKRTCEYAANEGNVFECTAPSDEAMTCR